MKTVYLAGPITGLDFAGATGWRNRAIRDLADVGIKGLSPMRGKDYLSGVTQFGNDGDKYSPYSVMSSNRGITTRDRYDATSCDVLLVNFLGATTVSIGTVMEIGWADSRRTPIVCAMEERGNPHDHGMVRECIGFRVSNLEEALHITKAILQ